MKKESTATRLKKIMETKDLRQVDVLKLTAPYCEQYGIKMNKSDISQYCSGKNEPNQEKLFVLGKALNVSESWLMGFDVAMGRNDYEFKDAIGPDNLSFNNVEEFKKAYDQSMFRKNRLEYKLLENMRKLNNNGKKSLLNYSEILLGNPNFIESNNHLEVLAAHERTDIKVTNEMRKHDKDIMMDDSEWE